MNAPTSWVDLYADRYGNFVPLSRPGAATTSYTGEPLTYYASSTTGTALTGRMFGSAYAYTTPELRYAPPGVAYSSTEPWIANDVRTRLFVKSDAKKNEREMEKALEEVYA